MAAPSSTTTAVVPVSTSSSTPSAAVSAAPATAHRVVPLVVEGGTFKTTHHTATLLAQIGGSSAIYRMTATFYSRFFEDENISKFAADKTEPHAQRLANWIVEKMGGEGTPWSAEREERSKCPVSKLLGNGQVYVVHDRSSAHWAAWNSPLRPPEEMGRHFKLPEARVWMRLMFLAAREEGLLENASFSDWFLYFIAHFVRIYEGAAPAWAEESMEWSARSENVHAYDRDKRMVW